MDTSNLYIGEVFVQEYSGKEIIEKRIGYRALIYIKEYGSYLTLAHHHEIYPKASQMPIGFKYLKEDVIPYSSFGPITCNNEEIIKALKEKIQELVNERWEKQNNIEDRKKIKFLSWYEYYDLCVIYYNHHGNLKIPERFKTINGYEYDEAGVRLGTFISKQRGNYQKNKLTEEQINLLKK